MSICNNSIKNITWIIADNRPGTYSQSLALAEAIGYEYKLIEISYNIFAKLPNLFLQFFPIHLSKKSKIKVQNYIDKSEYNPKFIISSGRKTSSIAIKFKKKFSNTKLIQIMKPEINYGKFDYVILPNHDKVKNKNYENLIFTFGALSRINDDIIAKEQDKFANLFGQIKKEIIVMLIGGNSKNNSFNSNSIKNLCEQISLITKNMNCHLIIFNSPRTDSFTNEMIKKNIKCDYNFFDYKKIKNNNPYTASLGFGNYFVITGDSVSMISECCSTGKPIYIFDDKKISSLKHRNFHFQLFKNKYALPLKKTTFLFNNAPFKKLQEAQRVALLIDNKF